LKKEGIHVAIDTAGVADGYSEILDLVDLVILDIKAVDAKEYKFITGREIDEFNRFLNDCISKNKKLWLRQVIVPNINDDEQHIKLLKDFAKNIPNVERIELLPYHSMAKNKYEKLGLEYKLADTPNMDKEKCKILEDLLK
jgi:pyruvate formate lyase activating enzyme